MNIKEMHVMFRQFAQQMGLQNVRAILPEQIDLLLNTSIGDTINDIIRTNIGVTNDRVITDNSKIGQINDLRILYRTQEFNCINRVSNVASLTSSTYTVTIDGATSTKTLLEFIQNGIKKTPAEIRDEKYSVYPGQSVIDTDTGDVYICVKGNSTDDLSSIVAMVYDGETQAAVTKIDGAIEDIGIFTHNTADDFNGRLKGTLNINPLFYVDFSINYIAGSGNIGQCVQFDDNKDFTTNYFPVRLIDDAYLSDTLNDFILKNRLRSPILVIYNRDGDTYKETIFDLYVDKISNGTFMQSLVPNKFRVSYIAKPAQVAYLEDINGQSVDCNLPEHLHIAVVKHAVDLYHTALTGDLSARQTANQQQNQEQMRNSAQPYSAQSSQQQQ